MTEKKRKRGRPRKIENTVEKDFPGVIGNPILHDAIIAHAKESGIKFVQQPSEKLIPPAGLSKVATLQWLTEHRIK
jgi:hypothetical protein